MNDIEKNLKRLQIAFKMLGVKYWFAIEATEYSVYMSAYYNKQLAKELKKHKFIYNEHDRKYNQIIYYRGNIKVTLHEPPKTEIKPA